MLRTKKRLTPFMAPFNRKGQAVFEYAIIIGIVVLALGMMQVYVRRGVQAGIKIAADELGEQEDSVELDPIKGTTQSSLMRTTASSTRRLQHGKGGSSTATWDESSEASGLNEYWNDWEKK